MTDSNIVSLHGGPIEASRKAQFLETVAEVYDHFIAQHGETPDALAFVMGGVSQAVMSGSIVEGRSEESVRAFICMASVAMTRWLMDDDL